MLSFEFEACFNLWDSIVHFGALWIRKIVDDKIMHFIEKEN